MPHPNATAAGGASILAVLVLLVARYLGLELTGEEGAAVAGGLATVTLLVGRNGVRGIARTFWRGSS